jgi:hypothetical protein
MPYQNEHAARQQSPSKFDSFRRSNNKMGSGIHVIFGIKDGKSEIQSIRFDASRFTPKEARAWLKEHNFGTALEEAISKANMENLIKTDENGMRYLNIDATYEAYAEEMRRDNDSLSDFEKSVAIMWASNALDTSNRIEDENTDEDTDEVEKTSDEPLEDEPANETDDIGKTDDGTEEKEWSVEIFAKSQEKQLIYGVVYSPNQVDTQSDFADTEETEAMAHSYLERHLKNIIPANDLNHKEDLPLEKVCPVESYVAPIDIPISDTRTITKGSWVLVSKVYDPFIWSEVKKGNLNAYSMKGKGRRIPVRI